MTPFANTKWPPRGSNYKESDDRYTDCNGKSRITERKQQKEQKMEKGKKVFDPWKDQVDKCSNPKSYISQYGGRGGAGDAESGLAVSDP